ncbi:hypothetical protein M0220_06255 [Halomonas qinghailakensis]|uniref:Lipoprotein n=1 Tax=Halomonas qinghailakensis TaxID=2937790 RepID=A0AA46TSY2_9GAMM|nr:hypothetical protein [Halomonas sp. ZZQ-149]UYO75746.1 hypothetical protein M0220_06255 [Halomonas sp. ZZQ-149]
MQKSTLAKSVAALSFLFLYGCSSSSLTAPSVRWVADFQTDEFTDESTCRVTVGSKYTSSSVYTYTGSLYPFVEKKEGEIRVGVMSGGGLKIPVGEVQLRIDQNPAWTISVDETPADLVPNASAQGSLASMSQHLTSEQQQALEQTYSATMAYTSKSLSPYTATTGQKADEILNQMLTGQKLIYRSVGFNQQGSNVGEYLLDESFTESLRQCGIHI